MADMVFSPTFSDLETEREVVLEEIAMVEDTPQELVHDLLAEAIFGGDPLGRQIIGTRGGHLVGLARTIARYHRQMYTAGNIVLAAAGNIEHDQLLGLLERAPHQRVEPPEARTRAPAAREAAAARPALPAQGHRAVPRLRRRAGISRTDRRRFAASILDAILGGSASSRLFQEIREKRGMAYAVYSFASQYTDTRPDRRLRGHARGEPRDLPGDRAREIADIAAGNVQERELRGRRRTSRGGSCCRWSPPRTG